MGGKGEGLEVGGERVLEFGGGRRDGGLEVGGQGRGGGRECGFSNTGNFSYVDM